MGQYTITGNFRKAIAWWHDPTVKYDYSWTVNANSDDEALYVAALISQLGSGSTLTNWNKTSYTLSSYANLEDKAFHSLGNTYLNKFIDNPERFINQGRDEIEYSQGSRAIIFTVTRPDGSILWDKTKYQRDIVDVTLYTFESAEWPPKYKVALSDCKEIHIQCPNSKQVIFYYARLYMRGFYTKDKTFSELREASHSDYNMWRNYNVGEKEFVEANPRILAIKKGDEFILLNENVVIPSSSSESDASES